MLSAEFADNYKKLVELLESTDKHWQRPYAATHKYRIMDPIPESKDDEDDVQVFDKRNFPRDYYDYIFKISNGGFGKFCGIMSLQSTWQHGFLQTTKGNIYIVIENQGYGCYTLLKIKGENTGCIAHKYGAIQDTKMSFKLYLLSPFLDDENFLNFLRTDNQYCYLYNFLMQYRDYYIKVSNMW